MSEGSKYAIGSLEQALSADPLLSPELVWEVAGREVRVIFRELPQAQIDRLRMAAIQYVEQERARREGDGASWRDVQSDLDVLRANRLDLLMLHAAMLDPRTMGPACSLEWLEKRLSPELQEHLARAYHQWVQGISPDAVTTEMVDHIFEEVKKKRDDPMLPVWLWTRCGYRMLTGCMLYMADLYENYRTAQSSGTESGRPEPTRPPEIPDYGMPRSSS